MPTSSGPRGSNPAFRRSLAVVGVGLIAGRLDHYSARDLQVEAARRAIEDAGLGRDDIDLCINAHMEAGSGYAGGWTDAFPRILGIPCRTYMTVGRGGAMASLSIMAAAKFLELGLARYALIAYGSSDWADSRRAQERGLHMIEREGLWGRPLGDLAAVSHHTFFAARHMHEYGTTPEQFGAVAVAQREWACLNPEAQMYNRPITLEDYLNSSILVWPYRMLDMCLVSDAGMAFVLTTADLAKNASKPPVYVGGIGFGEAMEKLWWDKANYTNLAVETAKQQAFSQAEITLEDIDVAEMYDCFTGEVLLQLEGYGWCGKGESGPFVAEGHTRPGGDVPVNTGGGLLSGQYIADFTGFLEGVIQLRGEGGQRQVPGAEVALVTGHGGEILRPGMCSIHSTLVLMR